jgi:hypothetical protein
MDFNDRDSVPNNDGKKLFLLVYLGVRLFDIQSKIFLYMDNPWILLFQMVCERSIIKLVFTEKLAVYDQWVLLSLSGIDSLITTPSKIIDPNNDAPAKCKEKLTFEEKKPFMTFPVRKSTKGPIYNFVERIKLYYNPKVH